MPQANQHNPLREFMQCYDFNPPDSHITAPIDELAPHIFNYWKMGKTDVETLHLLRTKHIDLNVYGLGYVLFCTFTHRI